MSQPDVLTKGSFTAAPLHLANVSHSYGALPAVRGVTIEIPAGTVCAVLGPNGAGKSTLAATIAGVVPTSPGSVLLDGKDVSQVPVSCPGPTGCGVRAGGRGVVPRTHRGREPRRRRP